jgi:hypothetical protein
MGLNGYEASERTKMRIVAIDKLRGIAIILMVFFTLILIFCPNVPDVLQHNIQNALRFGDFILPIFLFSSGMSLFFFAHKGTTTQHNLSCQTSPATAGRRYGVQSNINIPLKFLKRITIFWCIWVVLSPFSASKLLGMDELALSLFLSCITIIIVRCKTLYLVLVATLPMLAYLALYWTNHLPIFNGYLGGYAVLPFYLPVMLAGVIAAKHITQIPRLILPCALLALGLLLVIPPYKLVGSPSFMMLSILFSLIGFYSIQYYPCQPIEYIGRNPLRYWILMWIFIISALVTYPNYLGALLAQSFTWPIASLICLGCMVLLYFISKGMDFFSRHLDAPSNKG